MTYRNNPEMIPVAVIFRRVPALRTLLTRIR